MFTRFLDGRTLHLFQEACLRSDREKLDVEPPVDGDLRHAQLLSVTVALVSLRLEPANVASPPI